MRLLLLLSLVIGGRAAGADIWVDQDSGNDQSMGTRERPLATVAAGLARVGPGTTLHMLPGKKPWPGDIRMTGSGTPKKPIVIEGHGSIVSNRRELPSSEWNDEGGGIYSRKLPNNAWGMESHWEGGFPLVWFDGRAGSNVAQQKELHPWSYFLYKNRRQAKSDRRHNTLFICLPQDRSMDDTCIETIAGESGIYVGGDYVTVRNFVVEYGGRDGFATHRNQGVVFENVEARYFMDQGMSHHGAEVLVRNGHFHHNAGAGVVDVYPEVKVRYEGCLIESNTWRGGMELHSGQFRLSDCVIRGNPQSALKITKGATAELTNCLLVGDANRQSVGVILSEDSSLTLKSCTLRGFRTGLKTTLTVKSRLVIDRCIIADCDTNLDLSVKEPRDTPAVDLNRVLAINGNIYAPSFCRLTRRIQAATRRDWAVRSQLFGPGEYADFAALVGDQSSVMRDISSAAGIDVSSAQQNAMGDLAGRAEPLVDEKR